MFRNIVVLLEDNVINSNFLNVVTNVAKTSDGNISGVYVLPLSQTMINMPRTTLNITNVVDVEYFRDKAQKVHDKFESSIKAAGLKGEWFYSESRDVVTEVVRQGLYADLIMLSQADGNYKTTDKVILTASCPTLLVPPSNISSGNFNRILIAWKNTRESARALHDSLPLLHNADDIKIVTFGDDNQEKQSLTTYLTTHGINAKIDQQPLDSLPAEYGLPTDIDHSIGNRLITLSKEENSDLIVMGGFGHSRLGDAILSGVTLQISRNAEIPVLMSH